MEPCRPDSVIKSSSLRGVEVGQNIVERVDTEVMESLASKENAGVWAVERTLLKQNVIHRSKVRVDKDTPRGGVVSIETCGDNSETVVMMVLVIEGKEAGIELIVGVVEDVTLVAMPEHQMSDGAKDDVHMHKLTRKVALLNTDKMYGKQGVFIVIAKKDPVVIITDICIEFRFRRL